MSAGLKRGRITARIGKSESNQMPAQSTLADQLSAETDEKRVVLQKLCNKYDSMKGDLKSSATILSGVERELKELEVELKNMSKEQDTREQVELDATTARKHLNMTMKRRREEAELSKKELEQISRKHRDAEMKLNKLREKKLSTSDKQSALRGQLERIESEKREMSEVLEKDERVVRELSAYLARVAKCVFESQQKLEQLQLEPHSGYTQLKIYEKKLREEKRKQLSIRQKLEQNYAQIKRKQPRVGSLTKRDSKKKEGEDTSVEEWLERVKKEMEEAEGKWMEWQEKICSLEPVLAKEKATKEYQLKMIEKYETQTTLLNMQPTPTMYKSYTSNSKQVPSNIKSSRRSRSVASRRTKGSRTVERRSASIREEMLSVRQSISEQESRFIETSGSDVPGMEEYGEWPETAERQRSREQLVRDTEEMAICELKGEIADTMRRVNVMARQADKLHGIIKNLAKDIKAKQQEQEVYKERTEKVDAKSLELRLERDEKRRKEDEKRKVKEKTCLEAVRNLQEQRSLLETERLERAREMRDAELELTRLDQAYKTAIAWMRSADRKGLQILRTSEKEWEQKVEEVSGELEELELALEVAREANRKVKKELAVVKPYEEEAIEYERLLAQERQLDRQLEAATQKRAAEQLQESGHITFGETGT